MELLKRAVCGRLTRAELRRYVAIEAVAFWGVIFVAWMLYPAEHHYSIMTHTFSFLGSFDPQHNPQYWWVFSIAMYFWSVATLPLVAHAYRRFAGISKWGARAGAALFVLGSFGTAMVAAFPDARGKVIGNYEWTQIHEKAAVLSAAGYTLGVLLHGALLLKHRVFGANGMGGFRFNYRALCLPYAFWASITGVAVYHLVKWDHMYARMKAAAAASGAHIGSSWSEALNTRYSFPLWENIVIYTLYIFMAWFMLALPAEPEVTSHTAPASRA